MTTVNPGRFGPQADVDTTGNRQSMPRLSGVSSFHYLRMIEEKGNIGFWTSEFAANRITVSEGIRRLMAVDHSSDVTYADLIKIMHPDDRASHENMRDLTRLGQPLNREFRIIRADGTLRWIRNIAEVVADRDGTPIRAVGIWLDVTDQHEATRSVAEGWRSYKTLVSAIAPLQWKNLPDGTVVHREGWEGIGGECFDGSSKWLERIHPDDREKAESAWIESLTSGKVLKSSFRLRDIDGNFGYYISRAAPILSDAGEIREWLGVLIPIEGVLLAKDDSQASDRPEATAPETLFLEAYHIRAARAILQWSKEDLARMAGVSVSTVKRMESEESQTVRPRHFEAVRTAFASEGVVFAKDSDSRTSISFQAASDDH